MEITLKLLQQWDQEDSLASFRPEFHDDADQVLYLDGNSLGKLPKATQRRMKELVGRVWGDRMIRGWNEEWVNLPKKIAGQVADLLGAKPHEVQIGENTTLKLYQLAHSILLKSNRSVILTEQVNFPTDLYILQGLVEQSFPSQHLAYIPAHEDPTQAAWEAMNEEVGLMVLSMVQYQSGYLYDVPRISARARELGIELIWDVSHAIGVVPIQVDEWGMDYLVGCTYKYLNGGPGAPAIAWVHPAKLETLANPIWGWFSHAKPFDFAPTYQPTDGAERLATGTPAILSLAPVEIGVGLTLSAGISQIRAKSIRQISVLEQLFEQELKDFGFQQLTTQNPDRRGSHLTYIHPEGWRISKALIAGLGGQVVIPDFRPPHFLRLGIAPLYVQYQDIWASVQNIRRIMEEKAYLTIPLLAGEVP
ncbi:MAG: kynureninase [Spirosomataceae bacterium]